MNAVWRRRVQWLWREWVKPLLAVAIVLGSFRSAIADWNDVPSSSMRPTILPGDRVFVNKAAYDLRIPFTAWRITVWGQPARGDIVVLDSPHDGKRLVKRVIGLPGDRVEMHDHRLVVNGQPADYRLEGSPEPGVRQVRETLGGHSHAILASPSRPSMPSFAPTTVPEGSYMVMGDNRDNSFDSRWFGFVTRERIFGEVTAVVVSLDIEHHFRPRWGRFFSPLH